MEHTTIKYVVLVRLQVGVRTLKISGNYYNEVKMMKSEQDLPSLQEVFLSTFNRILFGTQWRNLEHKLALDYDCEYLIALII